MAVTLMTPITLSAPPSTEPLAPIQPGPEPGVIGGGLAALGPPTPTLINSVTKTPLLFSYIK
jgi:hypothetical protein